MNSPDLAFEGLLLFVWLLIGFALLSSLGAIFERLYGMYERNRENRELLPPPNVRSQRRARQWRVPL